jgi:hypothetical protein
LVFGLSFCAAALFGLLLQLLAKAGGLPGVILTTCDRRDPWELVLLVPQSH